MTDFTITLILRAAKQRLNLSVKSDLLIKFI